MESKGTNNEEEEKTIEDNPPPYTKEEVLAAFKRGGNNITALSLGCGFPTPMSAPHLIINSFKNLAVVGIGVQHEFKELK